VVETLIHESIHANWWGLHVHLNWYNNPIRFQIVTRVGA
jgi:hypothetical protein